MAEGKLVWSRDTPKKKKTTFNPRKAKPRQGYYSGEIISKTEILKPRSSSKSTAARETTQVPSGSAPSSKSTQTQAEPVSTQTSRFKSFTEKTKGMTAGQILATSDIYPYVDPRTGQRGAVLRRPTIF